MFYQGQMRIIVVSCVHDWFTNLQAHQYSAHNLTVIIPHTFVHLARNTHRSWTISTSVELLKSSESWGISMYSILDFLQLDFKLWNFFCIIKNSIPFQKFKYVNNIEQWKVTFKVALYCPFFLTLLQKWMRNTEIWILITYMNYSTNIKYIKE